MANGLAHFAVSQKVSSSCLSLPRREFVFLILISQNLGTKATVCENLVLPCMSELERRINSRPLKHDLCSLPEDKT